MKSLYSWLIVIALLLIGVGFYRGWLTLRSNREADGNKVNVNLTVDPDKVKQDVDTMKKQATDKSP